MTEPLLLVLGYENLKELDTRTHGWDHVPYERAALLNPLIKSSGFLHHELMSYLARAVKHFTVDLQTRGSSLSNFSTVQRIFHLFVFGGFASIAWRCRCCILQLDAAARVDCTVRNGGHRRSTPGILAARDKEDAEQDGAGHDSADCQHRGCYCEGKRKTSQLAAVGLATSFVIIWNATRFALRCRLIRHSVHALCPAFARVQCDAAHTHQLLLLLGSCYITAQDGWLLVRVEISARCHRADLRRVGDEASDRTARCRSR